MIELRDIKKTYITGEFEFHALKGINLTIIPNDYIALMGSSGSGKSTLMNEVELLMEAGQFSGSISIGGVSVSWSGEGASNYEMEISWE